MIFSVQHEWSREVCVCVERERRGGGVLTSWRGEPGEWAAWGRRQDHWTSWTPFSTRTMGTLALVAFMFTQQDRKLCIFTKQNEYECEFYDVFVCCWMLSTHLHSKRCNLSNPLSISKHNCTWTKSCKMEGGGCFENNTLLAMRCWLRPLCKILCQISHNLSPPPRSHTCFRTSRQPNLKNGHNRNFSRALVLHHNRCAALRLLSVMAIILLIPVKSSLCS